MVSRTWGMSRQLVKVRFSSALVMVLLASGCLVGSSRQTRWTRIWISRSLKYLMLERQTGWPGLLGKKMMKMMAVAMVIRPSICVLLVVMDDGGE